MHIAYDSIHERPSIRYATCLIRIAVRSSSLFLDPQDRPRLIKSHACRDPLIHPVIRRAL